MVGNRWAGRVGECGVGCVEVRDDGGAVVSALRGDVSGIGVSVPETGVGGGAGGLTPWPPLLLCGDRSGGGRRIGGIGRFGRVGRIGRIDSGDGKGLV